MAAEAAAAKVELEDKEDKEDKVDKVVMVLINKTLVNLTGNYMVMEVLLVYKRLMDVRVLSPFLEVLQECIIPVRLLSAKFVMVDMPLRVIVIHNRNE